MSVVMAYRPKYADLEKNGFVFSAQKKRLDLQYIYNLLCIPSRYSTGLPMERFALVIENSLCFGVFHTEFASLWDVFIDEPYRRQGLGKILMKYILEHPRLRGIFRWFLMTEDAHGLYQKYGFKAEAYNPYVMMKINTG
jgi:GNAT superfamily N-acetyltransferase